MKNTTQGYFCFDKSKQVKQQGSITTILLVLVLLVIAVGTYMYMQKDKAVSEGEPVSATVVEFEAGFE